MQSSKLFYRISKEFAQEVSGKTYKWTLPGIGETKNYPNTDINNLSRKGKEFNLTESDIELVNAVHGGHYKHMIPDKPNIDGPGGKMMYNAWATLMKNKTYSFDQKKETLQLLGQTLVDLKQPKPLKAKGIIPGQGVNKAAKLQANKNKSS